MTSKQFNHTTVMLYPAVNALNIKPDGIYIDGTYGRGGHSKLILSKLSNKGKLIVFDKDQLAINHATKLATIDSRITVIHDTFSNMEYYLSNLNLLNKVNGILLDLGISSPQIDDETRGFSFQKNGPLDMRMNQASGLNARELLLVKTEAEISEILWKYGEEKNSRKIASAIVKLRQEVSQDEFLPDTKSLVDLIIKNSKVKDFHKNPATRSFQALRIAVNNEIEELEKTLESSLKILAPQGIISIISFHSLEDRIVKQFFKQHSTPQPIPKNLPILDSQWDSHVDFSKVSKAIKPNADEVEINTRARSAILRWAEKK